MSTPTPQESSLFMGSNGTQSQQMSGINSTNAQNSDDDGFFNNLAEFRMIDEEMMEDEEDDVEETEAPPETQSNKRAKNGKAKVIAKPKVKVKVKGKKNQTKDQQETSKPRSKWWKHFNRFICEVEDIQKAECIYCDAIIRAGSRSHGTGVLKNHYNSCKKKPHDVATNQAHISFQPGGKEGTGVISSWKFDQTKVREALSYWFIVDELPFKTLENKGFRYFISIICPMFIVPSRRTITRDIYNVYVDEKNRLKDYIKKHAQRVCITTDTWTLIQRVNYMCLTAHFIDDNWTLQKIILNFCPISGHKSEEVDKGVEKCLIEWGIDRIFTITVDNASSNDGAIAYLLKKFDHWKTNVLKGKYVHMRCVAHIINLIVQDGLKNKDEHRAITRIRGAVRYIRNSPARYKRFKECVEYEKLETNKLLSLDVPTRWNSTYLMLESVVCLRRAFESYEDIDCGYTNDLSKSPYEGVPIDEDWKRAELLIKFLRHFYKLTLCISGSKYVTTNTVFYEISGVEMLLRQWLASNDEELSAMAKRMKQKYDKYWGEIEKMNMVLYFAVILDPRRKMAFLDFSFEKLYKTLPTPSVVPSSLEPVAPQIPKSTEMKEKVRTSMQEMFEYYKSEYETSSISSLESSSSSPFHRQSEGESNLSSCLIDEFREFMTGGKSETVKSELEKYLVEEFEVDKDGFDILTWWRVNSGRFPILSKIARDVLASPVSTVASESTFSTGGRVVDAFRSSLSPRIVQALVCAQDWLRLDSTPICVEEDLTEIEILDQELQKLGLESTIVDV